MRTEIFKDWNCDLDGLHKSVETWFKERGFETQTTKGYGVYFIQARKKGILRALVAASRALNVKIEGKPDNFQVSVGSGKWIQNIAATVLTGFLTMGITWVTGTFLTGWQKKTERDLWKHVRKEIEVRRDTYTTSPLPPPPTQRGFQYASPFKERRVGTKAEIVYCSQCGVKNDADSNFCKNCGSRLH